MSPEFTTTTSKSLMFENKFIIIIGRILYFLNHRAYSNTSIPHYLELVLLRFSNCTDVIMKKLNVPVSASDPVHKLPGVHRAPGRPGQP